MAETISDLSGAERDKRIAELKQKMQEAAKRAQGKRQSSELPSAPAPEPAAEQVPAAVLEEVAVAVKPVVKAAPARKEKVAPPAGNGAAAPKPAPAKRPASPAAPQPKPEPAGPSQTEMNRREFLTYAWGGALAFLALQGAVGSFLFMYPRFKAGEFGGKFYIGPESALPDASAAPQPDANGKFWLITTEEGDPKALYMVCTHLGCLYKWEASNGRFECPCHGSKFTHDGYYIEGPAPRSLDTFEMGVEDGQVVVDTGAKIQGAPASESPARVVQA